MTSEMTQQTTITPDHSDAFHPDFRSPSGDFVITSSDGVRFRVHRFLVQETSPIFTDMLSLPQPNPRPDEPLSLPSVSLSEDGEVIATLLRLTYPVAPPSFSDFDTISKVISAAEKYEMGTAIKSLRRILFNGKFFEENPMTFYILARRLEWDYEVHLATREILKIDLFNPANLANLSSSGFSSEDVARIYILRQNRMDKMRRLLDENELEFITCVRCRRFTKNEGPWLRLATAILNEMGRRPLGEGIFHIDFINDNEKYWEATCDRLSCGQKCFQMTDTLKKIKGLLNKVPACACETCDYAFDSAKKNVLLYY